MRLDALIMQIPARQRLLVHPAAFHFRRPGRNYSGDPELPGSLSWSIYSFLLVPLSPIFESGQRSRYNLQGYMMN